MTQKDDLRELWQTMHVQESILHAFDIIPREHFVRSEFKELAYADRPLPTLRSQSISQPTTIIVMLQALGAQEGDIILEVGAGVGYQAALLSELVGEKGMVTTLEVIPELVELAKSNITTLGINNVRVLEADGSEGFPAGAPYDKVIITAACPSIPQPIIDQLKEHGVVIAPIGDLESQIMVKGVKEQGRLEFEFLGSFVFVPMKGKHGFKEAELV